MRPDLSRRTRSSAPHPETCGFSTAVRTLRYGCSFFSTMRRRVEENTITG